MSTVAERNPNWKGDDATYAALHVWLRAHYAKPAVCWCCGERCGRMEWALKPGHGVPYRYGDGHRMGSRQIADYLPLGRSCHALMDYGHELTTVLGTRLKFGGPQ